MARCPLFLAGLAVAASLTPTTMAAESTPPETSYSADLVTIPSSPVARQWTSIRVTVARGEGEQRVLVPGATAMATVRGPEFPPQAYALETADEGAVFQTRIAFPRPGKYSVSFDITPLGRTVPFQTMFVVSVAAAQLPPAEKAALLTLTVDSQEIAVVDPQTLEVAGSVALPARPLCSAYDDHAPRLWVAFASDGSGAATPVAMAFDPVTLDVTETVELPFLPGGLAADATRLFLTDERNNRVLWFERGQPDKSVSLEVGHGPLAITLLPEKQVLCVANADLVGSDPYDSVSAIDLTRGEEIARLPVGTNPVALAPAADGQQLYVCSAGSGRLTVVDTNAWRVASAVNTAGEPVALIAGTTPGRVLVACRQKKSLALVDLSSGGDAPMLPLPAAPDSLAWNGRADGTVFIACGEANTLLALPASGKGDLVSAGVLGRPVTVFYRKATSSPP